MSIPELLLRAKGAAYLPAKLVQHRNGSWEISWWQTDPIDGIRKRTRRTFDINRIKIKKRKAYGS